MLLVEEAPAIRRRRATGRGSDCACRRQASTGPTSSSAEGPVSTSQGCQSRAWGWRLPAKRGRLGRGRGDGFALKAIQVCALVNGGGYADSICTAPAPQCLALACRLRPRCSAAAVPETFFTVWANHFHAWAG